MKNHVLNTVKKIYDKYIFKRCYFFKINNPNVKTYFFSFLGFRIFMSIFIKGMSSNTFDVSLSPNQMDFHIKYFS